MLPSAVCVEAGTARTPFTSTPNLARNCGNPKNELTWGWRGRFCKPDKRSTHDGRVVSLHPEGHTDEQAPSRPAPMVPPTLQEGLLLLSRNHIMSEEQQILVDMHIDVRRKLRGRQTDMPSVVFRVDMHRGGGSMGGAVGPI